MPELVVQVGADATAIDASAGSAQGRRAGSPDGKSLPACANEQEKIMGTKAGVVSCRTGGSGLVKAFEAPKQLLGDLDAEAAGTLIAAAADIALIVDGDGVIQDMAFGRRRSPADRTGGYAWLGRPWGGHGHRRKPPQGGGAAARGGHQDKPTRWRHINHHHRRRARISRCSMRRSRSATRGRVVAIGPRPSRCRHAAAAAGRGAAVDGARLRAPAQGGDALSPAVPDAPPKPCSSSTHRRRRWWRPMPAAGRLLGDPASRVVGRSFPDGFDVAGHAGGAGDAGARSRFAAGAAKCARDWLSTARDAVVSASLFRQDGVALMLVRMSSAAAAAEPWRRRTCAAATLDALARERAGRLRGHRPRRAHPLRQPRVPRSRAARDRGAGTRPVARALARPARLSISTC